MVHRGKHRIKSACTYASPDSPCSGTITQTARCGWRKLIGVAQHPPPDDSDHPLQDNHSQRHVRVCPVADPLCQISTCANKCQQFPFTARTADSGPLQPQPGNPVLATTTGNANPAAPAAPAARNLGNYHGTWGNDPLATGTLEWGVIIPAFFSIFEDCALPLCRLTYFLPPKLRNINAVLMTSQLTTLPLRRAGSIPQGVAVWIATHFSSVLAVLAYVGSNSPTRHPELRPHA